MDYYNGVKGFIDLRCFITNWKKTHIYCGDYNAQENQGSGNETKVLLKMV
jgi:hypothetical protein